MGFLAGLKRREFESTMYFSTERQGLRSGEAITEVKRRERRKVRVGRADRGVGVGGLGGGRVWWVVVVDVGDGVGVEVL